MHGMQSWGISWMPTVFSLELPGGFQQSSRHAISSIAIRPIEISELVSRIDKEVRAVVILSKVTFNHSLARIRRSAAKFHLAPRQTRYDRVIWCQTAQAGRLITQLDNLGLKEGLLHLS